MTDLLLVKVSTGIGAGIIAGGVLQRGARGAAGEIGHNPVADGGGVVCRCGNLDCLEAVASGAALVAALRAAGREVADVPGVVALVRAGDPEAVALVRHAGRRIGEVLAVAVNLLNPQVVVFGGDLAEAFEPLLAGVREQVYRRAVVPVTRELRDRAERARGGRGRRGLRGDGVGRGALAAGRRRGAGLTRRAVRTRVDHTWLTPSLRATSQRT